MAKVNLMLTIPFAPEFSLNVLYIWVGIHVLVIIIISKGDIPISDLMNAFIIAILD